MQRLIHEIRECLNVSQDDMAKMIGTSYATVNRWENGHSRPGKTAQLRLYDICREKGIDLEKLVLAKIDRVVSDVEPHPESLILYHGSKSGIKGPIAPISRDRCDFGKEYINGFLNCLDRAAALALMKNPMICPGNRISKGCRYEVFFGYQHHHLFFKRPFSSSCAEAYGDIRSTLEKSGTPIGPNDLMIAATVLSEGGILVTRNTREFSRIPLLNTVDWTK